MKDPPTISTKADARNGWAINDPLVSLRLLGTTTRFELSASVRHWTIGGSPECSLQLADPSGMLSRRHASLVRNGDAIEIEDLGSTNGLRLDGESRPSFTLSPGVEIGIGGLTLVAESRGLIALRRLLESFLGYAPAYSVEVDQALRSVRDMATRRAALVLIGEGDLSSLAHRLHRHALGHGQTLGEVPPFVVCTSGDGLDVLARAATGTLCLHAAALPPDTQQIALGIRTPGARTAVVFCGDSPAQAAKATRLFGRTCLLAPPPLAERPLEFGRVVESLTADAVLSLQAPGSGFREHDHPRLRAVTSLPELAEVTYRLVALRNWGLAHGAARLGITYPALSKWMRRRSIPT
ncbi:MAG: FHA domain-containing protein [Kofleriaceae bacterium]